MDFTAVDDSNSDEAVRILAQAFHDDPVMNWSCNTPSSLEPFFEFTLPVFVPHGLTYLEPQGRGAACWLGPGQKLKWPVSFGNTAKIMRLGGLRGVYRMLLSGSQTEKYHPKEHHYYLFAIGVTPGNKGQGVGSKLISKMLKVCDQEGMPAYLENSKPENHRFYEGHGFKELKEIRFAKSAPPLSLMWRDPIALDK